MKGNGPESVASARSCGGTSSESPHPTNLRAVNPVDDVVCVLLCSRRRVDERLNSVRSEVHAGLLGERTNRVRAICREVALEGATGCVNISAIHKSADAPVVGRRCVATQLDVLLEPDCTAAGGQTPYRGRTVDGLVTWTNGNAVIVAPVEKRRIQHVLTSSETCSRP